MDKKIPSEFRIICTSSTYDNELAGVKLMANLDGFNPQNASIYVNAVTTIVSQYMDENTGKTLAEAEEAVKAYLQIPNYVDIGSGLYGHQEYFSHWTFLEQASQNGGVDAFINQLAAQMKTSEEIAHPFLKQEGLVGIGYGGNPVSSYVANALLSGAINYAGSHLLGWALS